LHVELLTRGSADWQPQAVRSAQGAQRHVEHPTIRTRHAQDRTLVDTWSDVDAQGELATLDAAFWEGQRQRDWRSGAFQRQAAGVAELLERHLFARARLRSNPACDYEKKRQRHEHAPTSPTDPP
jgi:hypothetical protein